VRVAPLNYSQSVNKFTHWPRYKKSGHKHNTPSLVAWEDVGIWLATSAAYPPLATTTP
jgi:hypothetical protein